MLEIASLDARYGDFQALFGVDFSLGEGETAAVIGANGAGKSTLLNCIAGTVEDRRGSIVFDGADIAKAEPAAIARAGIALVPEGRRLFPSLSVHENLQIGLLPKRAGPWRLAEVYALFPMLDSLRDRNAALLSGGEQQMVAIGRALLTNPRVLLCDEISLGLAPVVIRDIYGCFDRIRSTGVSLVLVEQDVHRACAAADRVYCLLSGRVSLHGDAAETPIEQISKAYFGT